MGERIATFHSTLLGYLFGGGEGDGGLVNHLARGGLSPEVGEDPTLRSRVLIS